MGAVSVAGNGSGGERRRTFASYLQWNGCEPDYRKWRDQQTGVKYWAGAELCGRALANGLCGRIEIGEAVALSIMADQREVYGEAFFGIWDSAI
jgi:hypothetical protein